MNVLQELYHTILYVPILNLLVLFYHGLWDNMAFAIIALTIFTRIILHPFTKKQFETTKKQQEIQPQLAELKVKYKNKEVYSKKQMELMKQSGINPGAGCIVMLIPILIIIPLYRVFTELLSESVMVEHINSLLYNWEFLRFSPGEVINTEIWGREIAESGPFSYILLILAALSQFGLSWYMQKTSKPMAKAVKKTPEKSDDFMYTMQNQMMYIMPVMTLIIGFRLPAGLVLYWFVSTVAILVSYLILNRQYEKKHAITVQKDKPKELEKGDAQ